MCRCKDHKEDWTVKESAEEPREQVQPKTASKFYKALPIKKYQEQQYIPSASSTDLIRKVEVKRTREVKLVETTTKTKAKAMPRKKETEQKSHGKVILEPNQKQDDIDSKGVFSCLL